MSQTDDRSPASGDVVAQAIAAAKRAEELKTAAIAQLLDQQASIARNLAELGYAIQNGNKHKHSGDAEAKPKTTTEPDKSKKFRNMTLAEVVKILLQEHTILHGNEIERLAKEGGFKGGTKKFQNYLPVALKRDGQFINTGKNTWKLKEEESQ